MENEGEEENTREKECVAGDKGAGDKGKTRRQLHKGAMLRERFHTKEDCTNFFLQTKKKYQTPKTKNLWTMRTEPSTSKGNAS